MRHVQFPSAIPGTFIRCAVPSPSRSCIDAIARFAPLAHRIRNIASCTSPPPAYARNRFRCAAGVVFHQPLVVSLSCVPGYATHRCG
ncbi:MAG: hypothetical protein DWI11_07320 [Planctomycetota bacterium]|nr:MAG: hypothetical protein DWI11_07320 [Planctomycetota bacterium]